MLPLLSLACVSAPGAAVAPETIGGQGSLAQRPGAKFLLRGRVFNAGAVAVTLTIGSDLVEVVQLAPSLNKTFAFATLLAPNDAYQVRTGDHTCQVSHDAGVMGDADVDDIVIRCGASFNLTSGMAASVVIGQPDMVSSSPGSGAQNLDHPEGVIRQQPSYVQVADTNNNRVLVYSIITGNSVGPVPGQITGQVGNSNTPGSGADSFDHPTGLVSDGSVLFLADRGNNRVLQYLPLPNAGKSEATRALGQGDRSSNAPGCGPASMNQPTATFMADGHLFVSDTGNNRVLIWNQAISVDGQLPDVVLGQPDFTSCAPQAPAANSLAAPSGLWSDGQYLIVADTGNNRVLVWTQFPTRLGQPADLVLGQPDMAQNAASTTAAGLSAPTGIFCSNIRLFVADTGNSRVLGWGALPTASSLPATLVLGQADFTSSTAAVTATGFTAPVGLADVGNNLLVSDRDSNRLLLFVSGP